MKPAFQKDDEFLADVAAADGGEEHFHLWWMGQSGFLVAWNGVQLVTLLHS